MKKSQNNEKNSKNDRPAANPHPVMTTDGGMGGGGATSTAAAAADTRRGKALFLPPSKNRQHEYSESDLPPHKYYAALRTKMPAYSIILAECVLKRERPQNLKPGNNAFYTAGSLLWCFRDTTFRQQHPENSPFLQTLGVYLTGKDLLILTVVHCITLCMGCNKFHRTF